MKVLSLLTHVRDAADSVAAIIAGKSFDDYASDLTLRWAVERGFTIIGEAATRIRKQHPDVAARLDEARGSIAFRNFLIHVYDEIDDARVWAIARDELPLLRAEVDRLLAEMQASQD